MKVNNGAGKVYYGLHFVPGVAEYREPGKDPYRVFLNEDTIRRMNPTFAGCPVFVQHVDEVSDDKEQVRHEADGWVVESFFNKADGKTWTKFLSVTDRCENAIRNGWALSNAYFAKQYAQGGMWNGLDYDREIVDGEYEHLAVVPNPRYAESIILTPEDFKKYNEDKLAELARLTNSSDKNSKETGKMKLNLFKRTKVENQADIEGMIVALPKSGKELAVTEVITQLDERLKNDMDMAGADVMANGDHKVMVGESKMSVNELLAAHKALNEEMAAMKANAGGDPEQKVDMESFDNEEEDKEKEAKAEEEKKKNELEAKAKADKEKAEKEENFKKLHNARVRAESQKEEAARAMTSGDQVQRGKQLYGSG